MENYADRCTEVGRQPPHHTREHLDAASRRSDHDQVAMTVGVRVESIPFHRDSVRSAGGSHHHLARHTAGIPALAMSLEGEAGLTGMKTDADSPKGADRDLR
jgi:hypothetical protein